ncbi:MAG: hypothetical protein JJU06_20660 [Ectothiorhodospiraceae bacterium]|nr:hypothetical protein [Ectothiorhodospiraceae bacterium]MCH8504779.1 hypothetical protein [Ectothiorhodospiraceae bacterium]
MKLRWLCALLLLLPVAGGAESMRSMEPIGGTESDQSELAALSVPREDVEAFVRDLAEAWNIGGLEQLLAEDFPDRNRLIGDLADLPADARLRVLSIGPIRTLENRWLDDGLESLVLVRVRAQVEIEGEAGLERRDTTQELVVRFVRRFTE